MHLIPIVNFGEGQVSADDLLTRRVSNAKYCFGLAGISSS